MSSWKATIHRLGHVVFGIVICSAAAGPVAFLAWLASDAVESRSLDHAVARLRDTEPFGVLSACAAIAVGVLPSLALVALVAYGLGRQQRDTFVLATGAGATIGSAGVIVTVSALLDVDLDPSSGLTFLKDILLIFTTSAIVSAIYWFVAIRPQRRKRVLERQHDAAIRAME